MPTERPPRDEPEHEGRTPGVLEAERAARGLPPRVQAPEALRVVAEVLLSVIRRKESKNRRNR